MTIGYVEESIRRGERGMDTTWMPYMWPIKTCLLIGIIFLLNKIDFPAPKKTIEKTIPNENFKIVK